MWNNTNVTDQFDSILSSFFWSKDNEKRSSEVIIKEWNVVFYELDWDFQRQEIWWEITEDNINEFQYYIVMNKLDEDEDMVNTFVAKFKKAWHYNYSYIFDWIPLRINWSMWRGKSFMRIRRLPSKMPTPDDLNIPHIVRDEISKYKNWWLVVVSAPPGSWKSTTIASVLQELFDSKVVNAITLEDPLEYIYKEDSLSIVEQRERWLDFDEYSTWIEACMRQTPDIVVVQEMTTQDIVKDVMYLVEKWVLVITTLHTWDVPSIFESILSAYWPEWKQEILNKLAMHFKCCISQRLIKKKDWGWKLAIFEVLTNTNEVRWYIKWDNVKNLHQLMVRKPHLLFSDDIISKLEKEEISILDWFESCPFSRLKDLEDKVWVTYKEIRDSL